MRAWGQGRQQGRARGRGRDEGRWSRIMVLMRDPMRPVDCSDGDAASSLRGRHYHSSKPWTTQLAAVPERASATLAIVGEHRTTDTDGLADREATLFDSRKASKDPWRWHGCAKGTNIFTAHMHVARITRAKTMYRYGRGKGYATSLKTGAPRVRGRMSDGHVYPEDVALAMSVAAELS